MTYRINGIIRLNNSGDANLGIVTSTNIEVSTGGSVTADDLYGKISKEAITQQSAGDISDITEADELLIYDTDLDSLLRVSVEDFIGGAGLTTSTTSNAFNVVDESTDTVNYIIFTNDATGSQEPKSNTNLTFNASNGRLTATSFSGNGSALTDLNASNLTSGTIPDSAFPAILPAISGENLTNLPGGGGGPGAATIAVTDESSDTETFLVFTNARTGNQAPKTGTNLTQ